MKGIFNLLSLWSSWHSMPHLLLSWLVSLDRSFDSCDIVACASVGASCIERGVQVSFWLRMSIWGWRPGAENAHDSWQSLCGVTWLLGGCLEHVGAWLQEASVLAQVRSVFEASFPAPATRSWSSLRYSPLPTSFLPPSLCCMRMGGTVLLPPLPAYLPLYYL